MSILQMPLLELWQYK
ncbi:MAG TPA: hypothetical protein DIT07_14665 [Sphingobacteriaceae bacterium]|nr:hypothetical protein [Sphingobacteriaceae bacterium]